MLQSTILQHNILYTHMIYYNITHYTILVCGIYINKHIYIYIYIFPSLSMYIYIYTHISLSLYTYIYLYTYMCREFKLMKLRSLVQTSSDHKYNGLRRRPSQTYYSIVYSVHIHILQHNIYYNVCSNIL